MFKINKLALIPILFVIFMAISYVAAQEEGEKKKKKKKGKGKRKFKKGNKDQKPPPGTEWISREEFERREALAEQQE